MADTPKIEPCPYGCGDTCECVDSDGVYKVVTCVICPYRGNDFLTQAEAIAAHNKVAGRNRVFGQLADALRGLLRDYRLQTDRFAGTMIEDALEEKERKAIAALDATKELE